MLLPVLRPANWRHRSLAVHWPLWPDPWAPVVSYAYDEGQQLLGILNDSPDDARGVAALHDEAMRNLAAKPCAWSVAHADQGRPIVLQLTGEYAAERILLPALLAEASTVLGSTHLAIGVPDRQCLVATSAYVNPEAFLSWVDGLHASAIAQQAQPLFPFAVQVQDTRPCGLAAPAAKIPSLSPPLPPEDERLIEPVGMRPDGMFEFSCYLEYGTIPEEELFALRLHTSRTGPACVSLMDEEMARRAAPGIWTTGARVIFMNEDGEDQELVP